MYADFFKRVIDLTASAVALLLLSPVLLILALSGAICMKGNPFFVQPRPGKDERIFKLIKFRTMTNEKDENGVLLPDEVRLTKYGKFLRATSLDELPELFNIFIGDMAMVGPRPQLVRDMVFMSDEQRRRHTVRPGLTGYAQVNGRNNISWEQKLAYDIEYIDHGINFSNDIKIVFQTIVKAIMRKDTIREGTVSDLDFGDYLLRTGEISQETYNARQTEAKELLEV